MKSVLVLLACLLLLVDPSVARTRPYRYDARQLSSNPARALTAPSDCDDTSTAVGGRVLIGGRQNNGFGGGGGGRGGNRGGNRGGFGGGGGGGGDAEAAGDANAGDGGAGDGADAAGDAGAGDGDADAAAADDAANAGANAAGDNTNNDNTNNDNTNNDNDNNNNNDGAGAGANNGNNAGANNNDNNNNNGQGDGNAQNDGDRSGDNENQDAGNGQAPPVAANENGAPGPAVPVLTFNGGTELNRAVIQTTEANANATANQAASATSNNNFIDFCVGQEITNGLQNQAGSCNPIPIGQIPSTQNMVSTTFVSPKNFDTIPAGETFTIGLQTRGMTMGSFVNAQKNYYAAPQQLDRSGQVVGHAHIVIQEMEAIDSPALLDPNTFTFFKGLDLGDVNGLSTIDVQGGVPAGAYRLCTIMSASNHQSVIMPIAQRGAENTCSYFTAA
ncbi:hypothetical protein IAU59_000688 [Kwoniella sp. CBS 9459]